MDNFFIIRNKEKNMYYFGDGSWTKIKDCARKHQHKDCAEILMQVDKLDYKNCEIIEIPSIADLEAKLAESEKNYNDSKELWTEQFHSLTEQINISEETVNQLKQQLAECEQEKLLNSYGMDKNADIAEDYKQQLAEKEKENSVLKAVIDKNKTGQFGAVNICNAINEFYEPLVKDMIIAELEKVKDKTDALMFKINNMNYFIMVKEELYDFIDQQIKSLKGEK